MFKFKKAGENGYRVMRDGEDIGRIYSTVRCGQRMWKASEIDAPGLGRWGGVGGTREQAALILAEYRGR